MSIASAASSSATLSDGKIARIEASARAEAQRKLTPVEQKISTEFVLGDHLKSIGAAAKAMGVAVSFRLAGPETLKRLANGAPAKGHDILEKSIKPSKLEEVYGAANAPTRLKQMQDNDIDGFVGHWGDNGLLGLYMTPDAAKNPNLAPFLEKTPDGKLYYPVDHNNLAESLKPLRQHEPDWEKKTYTGDYDLHDMINLQGNRSPILAGSDDELRTRQAINTAVAATDPNRPLDTPEMAVVQHGPQYNYVAYMKAIENKKPDDKISKPSLPVAMCNRGEWSIISTEKELTAFYKRVGVNIKDDWDAGDTGSRRPSLAGSSSDQSPVGSRRPSMQADGRRASLPLNRLARPNPAHAQTPVSVPTPIPVSASEPPVEFSNPFDGSSNAPQAQHRWMPGDAFGPNAPAQSAPPRRGSAQVDPFASFVPSSLSQIAATREEESPHNSDQAPA